MTYRRTVGRSRRSGRRNPRSNQRRTLWVRDRFLVSATAPNTATSVLIPDTRLDPGARVGSTVMRILGSVTVHQGTKNTAYAGFYIGVAVTDVTGFSGGTTPPPILPTTNQSGVDWMHWMWVPLSLGGVNFLGSEGLTSAGTVTENAWTYSFDIRSRRVLSQPAENCIMVLENSGLANVVGVNFVTSTLIKLA